MTADRDSFRDPGGQVFLLADCAYRTVNPPAVADFDFVERSWVLPSTRVDRAVLGEQANGARYVLQHPKLPFASYPYEWPFGARTRVLRREAPRQSQRRPA